MPIVGSTTPSFSKAELTGYASRIEDVRAALKSNEEDRVKSSVNALGAFLHGCESQGKDVTRLVREADRDLIEQVGARGFKGLPNSYTDGFKAFLNSGARAGDGSNRERIHNDRGVDASEVQGKMPAATAKPALAASGTGMEQNADAALFFSVMEQMPKAVVAGMLGSISAAHLENNPKSKPAQELDALLKAEGGLNTQLDAFRSNRIVRDAVAIITDDPRSLSKDLRKTLQVVAEENNAKLAQATSDAERAQVGPTKPSELRAAMRAEMVEKLHGARPGILEKAREGLLTDENSAAFRSLPAPEQEILRAYNAQRAAIIDKTGRDPQSLTPQEIALLTMTPDEILAGVRGGRMAAPMNLDARLKALGPVDTTGMDLNDPDVTNAIEDANRVRQQFKGTLSELQEARRRYDTMAEQSLNEITSLLNSGLPIELIVMLVMCRLTEKHEENLKVKLKEAAAIESVERHNNAMADLAKKTHTKVQTIEPTEFGVPNKPTTIFMQELQVLQQQYMQIMQALAAIIRQVQDLVSTPIRNIR